MLELLSGSPAVFIAVIFAFTLVVGSFLNVVIYRLPVMMERDWREQCRELSETPAGELPEGRFDLVMPRSRCRTCGTQISALQNIPVLSYLALRGKCAQCKEPISPRYPIVEAATGALAAIVAWHFGFGWEALMAVVLTLFLVPITMIDFDHQLIPDAIVLPLMWIGLAMSLFNPLPGAEVLFISSSNAIIGAIAGYLSLWCVYQLFKLVTGKEGMGYGDFKLLAALGAWLGWQQLPVIIMMSAVVGAIVGVLLIVFRGRDRQIPIPFGPYLAAAGWISMLWGEQIKNLYFDLAF
jgi:leader peptidase (prepilin peptidase) / N-methyltransferase